MDVNLEPNDTIGGAAIGDGFQVTRWLRHISAKNIPAIIISATDKAEYRKYTAKIGAEKFIAKLLTNAVLLQSIEAVLAVAPPINGDSARL
jgi:DNA-binding response OmpR family regulator